MAVGTIALGEDSVIEASSDGSTWSPVSDINSYAYNVARSITNYPVFQREAAHGVPGAREITLTLSGLYSVADTGQDLIRDAEAAGDNVYIRIMPDGTNGISGQFRVASIEHSGTPEAPGEASFELAYATGLTDVGTGL